MQRVFLITVLELNDLRKNCSTSHLVVSKEDPIKILELSQGHNISAFKQSSILEVFAKVLHSKGMARL